jgi:tyrosinase
MATVRKRASGMTRIEQDRFKNVISQLISDGSYGQLVLIHSDMSHDQHGSMEPVGTQRFRP